MIRHEQIQAYGGVPARVDERAACVRERSWLCQEVLLRSGRRYGSFNIKNATSWPVKRWGYHSRVTRPEESSVVPVVSVKAPITYAEKADGKVYVAPTVHFTVRMVRVNCRKGYDVENIPQAGQLPTGNLRRKERHSIWKPAFESGKPKDQSSSQKLQFEITPTLPIPHFAPDRRQQALHQARPPVSRNIRQHSHRHPTLHHYVPLPR